MSTWSFGDRFGHWWLESEFRGLVAESRRIGLMAKRRGSIIVHCGGTARLVASSVATRTAAPAPAWPDEPRQQCDRVHEPIVAGHLLFVASSGNDSVSAFNTDSGTMKWRFYARVPFASRQSRPAGSSSSAVMTGSCTASKRKPGRLPETDCSVAGAADRSRAGCLALADQQRTGTCRRST